MFKSGRFWSTLFAIVTTLLPPLGIAGPGHVGRTSGGIYYTFKENDSPAMGGVVGVKVNPSTGHIISQSVIGKDRLFIRPHKVKLSDSGRYLLATSKHAGVKNLLLADLHEGTHQFLSVDRIPDDIGVWRDTFVVGARERMVYIIDAPSAKVEHRWMGRHELRPDGRRVEYVVTTPDGIAWTSWQKDSGGGNSKGSRLVTIDITTGKTIADLRLPRAMPQLNLADRKESGPNPEIVIPSPSSNTLLLSMDLYGGVALADLDAAKSGSWKNLSYHSVATDESWGTAFPDRAALIRSGSRDFVLIANAGKEGGISLIDLQKREVTQRLETPPGLSTPVPLPGGTRYVSTVPGKWKARSFGRLVEKRKPLPLLYLFTMAGERLTMRSIDIPLPCQQITSVGSSDLVFLTTDAPRPELLTVRATNGKIVDREAALGNVFRVVSHSP